MAAAGVAGRTHAAGDASAPHAAPLGYLAPATSSATAPAPTVASAAATATNIPTGSAAPAGSAEETAADGYVYGYSPVAMARTRADHVCHSGTNALLNVPVLSTPLSQSVVAPNVDTLYSVAWLDLREGPVQLTLPDTTDRYVVFELLDIYSNVFADIGTRLNGSQPGNYLITPPGWNGTVPAGTTAVAAPSWDVWALGRTLVNGDEDLSAARAVQRQYTVATSGLGASGPVPPALPPVDCANPPDPQTPNDGGAEFFDELAAVLAADPPPAADDPALAALASIGVVPGTTPSTGDPATVAALEAGVTAGEAEVQAAAENVLVPSGSWLGSFNGGTYGTDYLVRSAVAVVGLGANVPQESLYYWSGPDLDGEPLTGAHTYRMRFGAGQLPPVDAAGFWSVTMYDEEMFLVPNTLRRYALGDRSDLTVNADGSIDIYLSATPPAGHTANWLPAPDGPVNLMIRAYIPTEPALTNAWHPPAIEMIS
ncbi:DUF1254 domain-containing protein [Pseudofrankia sp. BMG5.37]|uniref:DUF1254 domain-containing protein n=1 Tax=Pseudofrankia sp. BMG5.37 TaxID=3050035 RepID=UPI002894A9CB|nr:DUF1254 domain-containing protein [Pseudofrankia sp. BMG5.37]MDT3441428.1 DUF1254 domain-containing protein [Pseudofrankia sp. BMG5.37]